MDYRRQAVDNALNRGLQVLTGQAGATVLIVSHDPRAARRAYRRVRSVDGRIACLSAEEVVE